jgi:hypothetical protein
MDCFHVNVKKDGPFIAFFWFHHERQRVMDCFFVSFHIRKRIAASA